MLRLTCIYACSVMMAMMKGASAQDVLVSMPIDVGGVAKDFQLLQGESIEGAASNFAQTSGLVEGNTPTEAENVIQQLSQLLYERLEAEKEKSLLWRVEMQMDGKGTILEMYDGETPVNVMQNFVNRYQIPEEQHNDLVPQLQSVIQSQVDALMKNQATNEPQWLFTLPLNLSGQQFEVNHFEGQHPVDEARLFCQENQILPELHAEIIPAVAQLIQDRLMALQQEQQQVPRRALLEIPLSLNGQEFVLVHYEGLTPLESVLYFLQERGVTDENVQREYIPSLLPLIEQQLEAAYGASTPQSTPVFSLPIVVGEMQVNLEYFEGETPEKAAEIFAMKHGLQETPEFADVLNQLTQMIRNELAARQIPEPQPKPLFSLPISLKGQTYDVDYFEGQEPTEVAVDFCKSKSDLVVDSEDQAVALAQLNECATFMAQTITSLIERLDAEVQKVEEAPLFSLEVNVGGPEPAMLPYYKGNDPENVAAVFCQNMGLAQDNVPALANALREEMAKL